MELRTMFVNVEVGYSIGGILVARLLQSAEQKVVQGMTLKVLMFKRMGVMIRVGILYHFVLCIINQQELLSLLKELNLFLQIKV